MSYTTRDTCLTLDRTDPLAGMRAQFATDAADAKGVIYLDGNSLGMLPRATAGRVRQVVEGEWGCDLISSWNTAGWFTLSRRIADKIAPLIGVGPGEIAVADSTSVNLYKALSAAMWIAAADTGSRILLSERTNFPTDLYIAETIAREHGMQPRAASTPTTLDAADRATAPRSDADARELPDRPHVRAWLRGDARGARSRARSSSGTWRIRPAPCRWLLKGDGSELPAPPISRSAAATST